LDLYEEQEQKDSNKMKPRCLVCRMGDDLQKVETLEILRGRITNGLQEGPLVRVPLCHKHKDEYPSVLAVMTGESGDK
jgi:hypothetical protein